MICAECKHLDPGDCSQGKYYCTYYRTYVYADDTPEKQRCTQFWEDRYRSAYEINSLTKSNSECIMTTACKKALGNKFSNTCTVLQTIRSARNKVKIIAFPFIKSYYKKSSKIIKSIQFLPNCDEILCNTYYNFVNPLANYIQHKSLFKAILFYRQNMSNLYREYCLKTKPSN